MIFEAQVAPQSRYRRLEFGAFFPRAGAQLAGTALPPLPGVVRSPSSEAAVRLVGGVGLGDCDALETDNIFDAVEAANSDVDFAGLGVDEAADRATEDAAMSSEVPQALLCGAATPLPTPTSTPMVAETPTPTSTPMAVDASTPTQTSGPGPSLSMEINPAPARSGEIVNVQIKVTNQGPVAVQGVEVQVALPDRLADSFGTNRTFGAAAVCRGGTPTSFCSAGKRTVWSSTSLLPGQELTLLMPPRLTAGEAAVDFEARLIVGRTEVASEIQSVLVVQECLLDVTLEEDADPIEPGQELRYRLTLGNRTTTMLTQGVLLEMPVPEGKTFLSAGDDGVFDSESGLVGREFAEPIGIGEGGSRDLVVRANDDLADGEVVRAEAQIDDSSGARTRAQTQTRVQVGVPLRLTMELNPNSAMPGETVLGQLTVSNVGPDRSVWSQGASILARCDRQLRDE